MSQGLRGKKAFLTYQILAPPWKKKKNEKVKKNLVFLFEGLSKCKIVEFVINILVLS